MKRKFLSKRGKVLALALAAAMAFPMLPMSSVQAAPSVSGGNESPSVSGGDEYVVQKGDTLYGIAKKLLGSGSKWKELRDLNSIENENLIRVGQVLKLK